jgi:hypothetical protein
MKRVFLAGILGAIAMFAWTSVSHMVLPLGTTGVSQIPNEAPILSAMNASIGTQHGLYIYPALGVPANASMKEMRDAMPAYQQKLATMPSGLIIYHPPGQTGMTGAMLGLEFGKEFVITLSALALLSMTRLSSYGAKVGFMAVVGVIAAMATNVSYFVWYGFPGNYTLAYMFVEWMGFVAAGLAGAAVMRRANANAAAA